MTMEKDPSLMGIHRSFAETDHGKRLAGQVRYDRYKPETVANDRWIKLLGADVNNLTHLTLTWGLTRSMISRLNVRQPGLLTDNEARVLEVAALIHDWAEAIVGDITYDDKTDEHWAEERGHLAQIIAAFEGADSPETLGLIDKAAQEVVFCPETKLGYIFNTVERVGYVRTALRASQHVVAGTAPECDSGLRWLVSSVFGNHITTLVGRADTYMPVSDYLRAQQADISQAFTVVQEDVFGNYPFDAQQAKRKSFRSAELVWADWAAETI